MIADEYADCDVDDLLVYAEKRVDPRRWPAVRELVDETLRVGHPEFAPRLAAAILRKACRHPHSILRAEFTEHAEPEAVREPDHAERALPKGDRRHEIL